VTIKAASKPKAAAKPKAPLTREEKFARQVAFVLEPLGAPTAKLQWRTGFDAKNEQFLDITRGDKKVTLYVYSSPYDMDAMRVHCNIDRPHQDDSYNHHIFIHAREMETYVVKGVLTTSQGQSDGRKLQHRAVGHPTKHTLAQYLKCNLA